MNVETFGLAVAEVLACIAMLAVIGMAVSDLLEALRRRRWKSPVRVRFRW